MHFWGQIWVRVKFEGKNGFKTIILIYPENLGHLDIFLSKRGQLKNSIIKQKTVHTLNCVNYTLHVVLYMPQLNQSKQREGKDK